MLCLHCAKLLALLLVLLVITTSGMPAAAQEKIDPCARAQQLYKLGKFASAVDEYSRVLHLEPGNAQALRGRGLCLLRLGDFPGANKEFDEADSQLGPYRETKFPGIGGYQDWSKAQKIYQEANQRLEDGQYDQAIADYKLALQDYPYYPQALHNLAIAYGKKGQYNEAAVAAMEAISLRHRDWKFWKTLGVYLFKQNHYRLALESMEQALHLNPPEPDKADIIDDVETLKATKPGHQALNP